MVEKQNSKNKSFITEEERQSGGSSFEIYPNSRSRSRSRSNSKNDQTEKELRFKRYRIFMLVNPRSGDGLAKGFLTDFPHQNSHDVFIEEQNRQVSADLRIYNVREKQETQKCLEELEAEMNKNDK